MKYLNQEEKQESRKLWKEVFPEDSESFSDYYYSDKIRGNQILAEKEDNQIISMVHLNPYRIMAKNQLWKSDYIVGVATAVEHRHKGHMRSLLTKMMEDMYDEGRQFCFLMPANDAIYKPFDFTYIFNQPHWKLKRNHELESVPYDLEKGSEFHPVQELADWMNSWMHKRYQVYAFRDEEYIRLLLKELASEQGELNLLYNENRLVGIECWWGIEKREQRMLLCEEPYREEEKEATPAIMARIIHLQNFVKVIGLKKNCGKEELSVQLIVKDSICQENAGVFLWHLSKKGSVLEKMDEGMMMAAETSLTLNINDLTAWLFGYSIPEEGTWMDLVQPLQGVYLDEIV